MHDDRHIWLLDPRVLEYVKFGAFHWWELLIIAGVLLALLSYALFALFLDRRARAMRRRSKQLQRLDTWLAAWKLAPEEEASLWALAGERRPLRLYALLADPVRFERAVHGALTRGTHLPWVERVRMALGYHSDSPGTPIVSTRQLLPGDHVRLAVWEEGQPQHHYGIVTGLSALGVVVELTEAGYQAVTGTRGETDLFYLRGDDLEVRLPFLVRSTDPQRHRLLINHDLVRGGQRPRGTRLPMLRPMAFRVQTALREDAAAPIRRPANGQARTPAAVAGAPTKAPPRDADWPFPEDALPASLAGTPVPASNGTLAAREVRGVLLEMSEGGFSLLAPTPVAEGAYVDFTLALPSGRSLAIMGRVLDCRDFTGHRWLARCELRGLPPSGRNLLGQLLRLEQQRRLRALQAERRRRQTEADP